MWRAPHNPLFSGYLLSEVSTDFPVDDDQYNNKDWWALMFNDAINYRKRK